MKAVLALLATPMLASAQFEFMRFWRDAGCPSDPAEEAYFDLLLPAGPDGCQGGTAILGDDWPVDEVSGEYIVYISGEGIGDDCTVGLLRQNPAEPGACGETYATISGGTAGPCRQTTFGQNGGLSRCCGTETCSPAKRSVGDFTAADEITSNVVQLKSRSPFSAKRQDDCSFSASGTVYDSRGAQQIVTRGVSCPAGDGSTCSIGRSASVTTGSSNSFGASVEAGVSFFEIVQTSVSFSYDYTYSESTTRETNYNIGVPASQSGYITYTPALECINGVFNGGSCGGWTTGEEGAACVPKLLPDGTEDGDFAFVREI